MTCCRPPPAFFFAPLFPSTPAICRYLLPLVRVVFASETAVVFFVLFCPSDSSYLFRVVSPVQQKVYVPLQHVHSSSCSLSFPFLSDLLASHSSEHLSFVLIRFVFFFCFVLFCLVLPCLVLFCFVLFCLVLFSFSLCCLFLWSGLLCCVLVPGTLALRLLYLDELRLLCLLCFSQ